jgi:site-specific recombinase XerD
MFDRMLECMGDTLVDLRDRAILRLLMSTGIRISGVAAIDLGDMTTRKNSKGRRVTTLRYLGKGHDDKDQTVLVGRKAVDAIERYLKACDPPRDLYKGSGPLFLALRRHHGRMKYEGLYRVVKLRVAKAGLDLRVGPHSFRHMAAIEMWKATKDLRRVQKMLGHSSMVTTEGYLRSLQEDQGEDDEMVIDW